MESHTNIPKASAGTSTSTNDIDTNANTLDNLDINKTTSASVGVGADLPDVLSPSRKTETKYVSTWSFTSNTSKTTKAKTLSNSVCASHISDLSDSEQLEYEPEATDNLLGRLRRGISLIETHARQTVANCETEESRQDMAQRLEKSTLGMLKAEKSFLSTSRLIAEVVDEFASDYEDEADEDDPMPIFRPSVKNRESIRNFGDKISTILQEKMNSYEEGLTDDVLKKEGKFVDLQRQVRYGRRDAERLAQPPKDLYLLPGGAGDAEFEDFEEFVGNFGNPGNFDSDSEGEYDEPVLPSIDPISMELIHTAVRNKLCNHVFEKESINRFILENPDARCPMIDCRNEVAVKPEHLVDEPKMTEQIRLKNRRLFESLKLNRF